MRTSALKETVSRRALAIETKGASDSMPTEVKAVVEEFAKTWEEFKAANDAQIGEIKKGLKDCLTEEKVKKINDALDALQAAKDTAEQKSRDRMDDIEKRLNRLRLVGGTDIDGKSEDLLGRFNNEVKSFCGVYSRPAPTELTADDMESYAAGFKSYLRRGDKSLAAEHVKSMSVGSDPEGGYLVTPNTSGRLVKRVFDMSPIRQIANVIAITTDSIEGLRDRDDVDAGWIAETTTPDETDAAQVGKYKIDVHEMYAQPKATQKLLEDSAIDIEAWLADKLGSKFARLEGTAFVVGNGNGKPRGFTTETLATTDDDSRADETLQYVKTGVDGGFAATNPADIFFDLLACFRDAYLQNARFVTRREVIALIRKFKGANGDYLWQPGLGAGQPQSLLTFPVTISQDMPALSAKGVSLAVGDFMEGYQIVDRLGIQTLRDPFTSKPYVKFYTRKRVGGRVVNFDAIKFIKFAA